MVGIARGTRSRASVPEVQIGARSTASSTSSASSSCRTRVRGLTGAVLSSGVAFSYNGTNGLSYPVLEVAMSPKQTDWSR